MKKYLLSMLMFCSLGLSLLGSSIFSSSYQIANLEKEAKNQVKIIDESAPTELKDLQNADDEQLSYWAKNLDKFDGREFNYITPTRNQYNKNTCWVFAAVGAAETNILRTGIDKEVTKETLDFDETIASYNRHTRDGSQDPLLLTKNDTYNYGHWNQGDTGAPNALSIMTQGYTLLDENHFHSSVANDVIKSKLKQSKYFVKSYQCIDDDKESIKKAILKYGAVTFNYSAPSGYFYFSPHAQSNHTSIIIGWDDTIKTSSFHPYQPENDGAWIIKNSWGDDFYQIHMVNNTTAYYISYEQPIGGLYIADVAKREDYQNIYYYDGDVALDSNSFGGVAQGAIYEAKLSSPAKQEQLKAVSIYVSQNDVDVNIKIYKNLKVNPSDIYDSMNSPEQNMESMEINTHIDDFGMHTIDLERPLNLNQGEYFSIVVRCKTKYNSPISVRCARDNYASTNDMTYYLQDGKWINFKTTNRSAKIRAITNTIERKEEQKNENDLSYARIEIENRTITYEKNKELIPNVQVYFDDVLLKKDQDYLLNVQEITSPGIQTLEIIGINDYQGKRTTTFEIKKAHLPPGAISDTLTIYNDIEYLYDINIPTDWTWVDENKKLEYGLTTYPVSLKYIGKDKDFYEVITCDFYILKLNQDFPDSIDISLATIDVLGDYIYNGTPIIPNVQITYENHLLHEGSDYLLTFQNNIEAGTASIFIKGKEHFCNEISKTFTIQKANSPKNAPQNIINVSDKITHLNQIPLNDENWRWENENQEITNDVFKANAIYIGKDSKNYINTKIEITIIRESRPEISSLSALNVEETSFIYDGKEKTPLITIKDGNYTLIQDVDYIVEYQNNINAGIASMIVQGINNYQGTKIINFTIEKAEKPNVETTIYQEENVSSLSDITLPEGFIWEDESIEIVGNKMVARAIYIGDDANNYETTELTFEIILEEVPNQNNQENLIWVALLIPSILISFLGITFFIVKLKLKNGK